MAKSKKAAKKKAKKPAPKKRKKAAKKAKAKPVFRETRIKVKKLPPGLNVSVLPELEARLHALAKSMGKSIDEVLTQAMQEFADAWEDHMRTVAALQDDDRVQLAVGKA